MKDLLIDGYGRTRLIKKSTPFVLFFDPEMLEKLKKKYKTNWRGGDIDLFVASTMEHKGKVNFLGKSDLEEWNKQVGELDRDKLRPAKDVARVALMGPLGAIHLPMNFVCGMEFVDFQSVVLIFGFLIGTIMKKVVIGAMSFPNTPEGREGTLEYFKNMVMETSANPISEESWRSIEKIRKRIASNVPNVEGLEENLWKTIL
jgi:hypothetical protein